MTDFFKTIEADIVGFFTSEEAKVVAYLKPLVSQIVAAAEAVGKETFEEGLQVLIDAAKAGVAAGAPLILTGNVEGAEAAAAAGFLAVGATEGVTVIHNAEAAMIKATVAASQAAPAVAAAPTPAGA